MLYLVTQIAICLLIGALIGAAVGWLLRGAAVNNTVAELELRAAAAERARLEASADLDKTHAAFVEIKGQHEECPERIQSLVAKVDEFEARQGTLDDALEAAIRERDVSISERDGALAAKLEAEAAAEEAGATLPTTAGRRESMRRERDAALAELESVRARLAETERKLAEAPAAAEAPTPAAPAETAAAPEPASAPVPPAAVEDTAPEVEQADVSSEAPQAAMERLSEPSGAADNLKRIKGVGPKLESLLNSLGVFHFHQIANMSEADVAQLEGELGSFGNRVRRQDWVSQAKDLMAS